MKYYTEYTDKDYLLNIQQQVEKNKRDIATHYQIDRTLADYGIRIIGFYETIEDAIGDLGDPYDGPYGNAIGIGVSAPYTFYIWTRANNLSNVDYWQDVGELAVVGPEGPMGPQGEQGPAGENAKIFTGRGVPTISIADYSIYIDAQNGDVYKPGDGEWILTGNIRGPQGLNGARGQQGPAGPQGPKGEKGNTGDPGGFIKIAGFKVSEADLPDPEELQDLEIAYLVGAEEPYVLWIQVGATYEDAIWYSIGVLNLATYITVNGEFQNTWDADTKLDKITQPLPNGNYQLYAVDDEGSQTIVELTESEDPFTIVQRSQNGEIFVPEWPVQGNEAVSKVYVDTLIQDSDTITTYWEGPDLSLHLNAELVAQIGRAVVAPVSPLADKTIPQYNRSTSEMEWVSTGTYATSASQPKYQNKTSSWLPTTMGIGNKYCIYPYSSSGDNSTFAISALDIRQETLTLSNLTYAEIYQTPRSYVHIFAIQGDSTPISVIVNRINSITSATATVEKHGSGSL